MSKTTIKILIGLSSFTIIILLGVMIYFLNNDHHFPFSHNYYEEKVVDEVITQNIDTIKIISSASDITFKHSKDNSFRVVAYSKPNNIEINIKENTININDVQEKCHFFCWNIKLSKIEVYLPDNYQGLVDIQNAYGDISVSDYLNATFQISENCGDVQIDGAATINITNDLGDISIGKVNLAKIEANAGNVTLEEAINATIKNDLGDITIKKVTEYLDVENNCGDIRIDNISLSKNSRISADLGDIKIGHTNQIYIDAATSLGDIDIQNNYREAQIILKIQNNCGDISVKN